MDYLIFLGSKVYPCIVILDVKISPIYQSMRLFLVKFLIITSDYLSMFQCVVTDKTFDIKSGTNQRFLWMEYWFWSWHWLIVFRSQLNFFDLDCNVVIHQTDKKNRKKNDANVWKKKIEYVGRYTHFVLAGRTFFSNENLKYLIN